VEGGGSEAIRRAIGGERLLMTDYAVIGHLKAVKNEVELEGFRRCHVRDGAALVSEERERSKDGTERGVLFHLVWIYCVA
jgi:Xaa-Pro aminopeptidase